MEIVVLDGYTLNPGDLSWAELENLGEVRIYDRTSSDEIVFRAKTAEAIITNKAPLAAATLDQLPGLKYIGVTATGFNIVDIESSKRRGVTVTNVPAYSTASVAQLVFAFILEHCHNVGLHSELVHQGEWTNSPDFAFWKKPLVELQGRTLAIIGYGNIGRRVAQIALAFGMRVLINSRTPVEEHGLDWRSFPDVVTEADFVSLHCPLTDETRNLINVESLNHFKDGAFLINTSRGPLVDEAAVCHALESGKLAGAGIDVLSVEPPDANNPLLRAPNTFITPHIAWATHAARARLMEVTVGNLKAFLDGNPQNVVS